MDRGRFAEWIARRGSLVIGVIGLGSNLGERVAHLIRARELLGETRGIRVKAASHIVETDAHGPPQPRYLNAALKIETSMSPEALLDVCLGVERALGRLRAERWGPRTIDLDLLLLEGLVLDTERLTVPHPHLLERAFALGPLLELIPTLPARYHDALRALGGPPETVEGAPAKGWTSRGRRT